MLGKNCYDSINYKANDTTKKHLIEVLCEMCATVCQAASATILISQKDAPCQIGFLRNSSDEYLHLILKFSRMRAACCSADKGPVKTAASARDPIPQVAFA